MSFPWVQLKRHSLTQPGGTVPSHFHPPSDAPNHSDLIKRLHPSPVDQIMLHLAFFTLRSSGHRHGAFLDAAATAAKCAIYLTYIEQGENLRMTGHLHHLEPKRVKAIVQEVQAALTEGKLLKLFGSHDPRYLIQLPHLWLERYPWTVNQPRFAETQLLPAQQLSLTARLPATLPNAQVLSAEQFTTLLEQLHGRSQADWPVERRLPCSDALTEHMRRRLLYAGTVTRIDSPWGPAYYALTQAFYAPANEAERTCIRIEDAARFLQLMQDWVDRRPHTMRVLEELEIPAAQIDRAFQELDQLLRDWADRHHHRDGEAIVLQMAIGERDMD